MQRNRSLAKYRICGFYFVHDLFMITFFSVLSWKLLHCIVPVCLSGVCIWIKTNMLLLFSFLNPKTFLERYGISLFQIKHYPWFFFVLFLFDFTLICLTILVGLFLTYAKGKSVSPSKTDSSFLLRIKSRIYLISDLAGSAKRRGPRLENRLYPWVLWEAWMERKIDGILRYKQGRS